MEIKEHKLAILEVEKESPGNPNFTSTRWLVHEII